MSVKRIVLRVFLTLVIVLGAFVGYVVWQNRPLAQTQQDADILRATLELLSVEAQWARDCDRKCAETSETLTLYCALRSASIALTGEYRHRAAALQAVRRAIESARPNQDYSHRLMDFNNDPGVTFTDLRSVLESALAELETSTHGEHD